MKTMMDIPYSDWGNGYFDLYLPDGECRALIIWFHGGGLENGSRKSIKFAQQLTDAGVGAASVEYRMYPNPKSADFGKYPDGRFPNFVEDCANAVSYILKHREELGLPERIYVSGQSAGAWLTMMLAMNPAYLEAAGADRSAISGWISDSAQITTHFNVLRERGLDTRLERIDEAAPICYLTESCPVDNLQLIWYTDDMPCRPEQNKLMLKSLKRFFPDRNIRGQELPGKHCNGSTKLNERGTYDYADIALAFIGE